MGRSNRGKRRDSGQGKMANKTPRQNVSSSGYINGTAHENGGACVNSGAVQIVKRQNIPENQAKQKLQKNGFSDMNGTKDDSGDPYSSPSRKDRNFSRNGCAKVARTGKRRGSISDYIEKKARWLYEPEYFVPEKSSHPPKPAEVKAEDGRVHSLADSLFSTSSGFNNYRGLLNLGIVLLVLSFTRVALENLIKYGILINPLKWAAVLSRDPYSWPSFCLVLVSNAFVLICFYTEVLLSKNAISEKLGFYVHIANQILVLVFPAVTILYIHPFPFFSSIALSIYTVIFLKLISYSMVNSWCREHYKQHRPLKPGRSRYKSYVNVQDATEEETEVVQNGHTATLQHYPENLNLKDIYYFMFAPTLCYELNFPRSARVRKRFLTKRIAEMVFLLGLMFSLVQQWIVPTVHNSMVTFKGQHYSKIAERIMKLAVPNHIIWLIFFYWFFHSCLNVLAELLRFGDRVFYRDWWNSETVQYFWQNWNIPVHRWATRHLYKPLLSHGWSRLEGSLAVFFVSAFFHEYLVSVPLKMFRLWAFMSMIGQVPFALFVSRFLEGKYGNMAVWLSLIMGQPIAILMYYHDYYIINLEQLGWLPFSSAVPTLAPETLPVS